MSTNNDVAVIQKNNAGLMKRPEPVGSATPLADIYETPDAYVLMLDMPGAKKDSISITIDQSSLVIGSEVETFTSGDSKLVFSEIPGVGFHRVFNLTEGIDRNNIDARYEDGVLIVKMFKKEEVKPREIRIK